MTIIINGIAFTLLFIFGILPGPIATVIWFQLLKAIIITVWFAALISNFVVATGFMIKNSQSGTLIVGVMMIVLSVLQLPFWFWLSFLH